VTATNLITPYFDYDVEWNRVLPALVLWLIFSAYWSIAGFNAAPTATSESRASTVVHQVLLNGALILLIWEAPGLTGWFLPRRWHFLVAVGVIVQVGFMLLAVWARRHLGRNWSAEVRIAADHQLVRTGPYRLLRHPIYTAMLGMFLGTAIASSQYHALVGLAILALAYLRKTRLEEQILGRTFGAEYDAYRRDTWALVPMVF
jgi:protein-S-isoprenylcysteine O-methyltransferase Ste14